MPAHACVYPERRVVAVIERRLSGTGLSLRCAACKKQRVAFLLEHLVVDAADGDHHDPGVDGQHAKVNELELDPADGCDNHVNHKNQQHGAHGPPRVELDLRHLQRRQPANGCVDIGLDKASKQPKACAG